MHEKRSETWHRYNSPESIAKVIYNLGKGEPVDELKRLFPKAVLALGTVDTLSDVHYIEKQESQIVNNKQCSMVGSLVENEKGESPMVVRDDDTGGDEDDVRFDSLSYI